MAKRIACSLLLVCLFYALLPAQVTISPYSRYGLGNLFDATSTRDFSMGGLGIGNYNRSTVNRINPASYGDIRLTTLDLSTYGGYITQNTNSNSFSTGVGGFHNLSFAFANRKNWGLVVGLTPYSSTGYNIVTQDQILVDTTLENSTLTYSADGGLNRFYAGFGAKFFGRLNVGMNLSYAFGNTTFNWENDFDNSAYQTVRAEKRVSLSGLLPQFGVQYGDTLKFKLKTDKLKELEREFRDMENDLASLAKEKADRKEDDEALEEDKVKMEAKKAEYQAKKDAAMAEVDALSENEKENRKKINKLQEKAFRLEKKKKKIEREIKVEERKIATDLNRLDGRMGKVKARQEINLEKQQDIRDGNVNREGTRVSKVLVRLGGILETPANLKGERILRFDNGAIFDTLGTISTGGAKLPLRYGLGFTLGKPFKWTVGADVSLQDWSKFEYFNETNTLKSSTKINVGAEWIPKIISPKFFQRTAYRIGAYYQDTQLNPGGNPIAEWGITAGLGIPMGFFNSVGLSYSRINIGISVGKRGNLNSNLLEESVIMLRLGVNLNDVWFIKRVVD